MYLRNVQSQFFIVKCFSKSVTSFPCTCLLIAKITEYTFEPLFSLFSGAVATYERSLLFRFTSEHNFLTLFSETVTFGSFRYSDSLRPCTHRLALKTIFKKYVFDNRLSSSVAQSHVTLMLGQVDAKHFG